MTRSPGHQRAPEHRVAELEAEPIQIAVAGTVVAVSGSAIRVEEDNYPPRHYLPRGDVNMELLEKSDKTSHCPFKGTANYFHIKVGDQTFENAAWSYEDPFDEHTALAGMIAFYDEHSDIYLSRRKKTVP